jgi:PAS domain S-box-containing protein
MVAVAGVVAVLLFSFVAWDSRRKALEAAAEYTRNTAAMLHEHALKVFETHALILNQIDGWTERRDWDDILADERLQRSFRAAADGSEQVKSICITDASGAVRIGSMQLTRPINVADRDYFLAQRDHDAGIYISAPYIGRVFGGAAFAVSRRRTAAPDTFDGVIVVSIDPRYFIDFWKDVARSDLHAAVFLTRADGTVLARYPALPGAEFRLPGWSPLVQAAGRAAEGTGTDWRSPIDGSERIVSFKKLAGYPVYVSFSVGRDAVLERWHEDRAWHRIFALTAILTLAILGWLAVRRARAQANAEADLRGQLGITRAITENTAEALFLMDAEGRVTFMNPAAERMFGWTADEVCGHVLHDRLHHRRPDGKPFPLGDCPLVGAMAAGTTLRDHEDLMFCKNGTPVHVICSNAPIVADGRVTGAVLALHDITRRRETEEALRKSEAHLSRAQQVASIGSFEYDVRSDTLRWSAETYRMIGCDRDSFVLTVENARAMVHPDDVGTLPGYRDMVANGGKPRPGDLVAEYRIIRPDGEVRVVRRECDLVFDADDKVVSVIGTVQDVTEIREAERERGELEAQLLHAQKLESLGTLAGGIAHDLNNTMTPVVALSKLVQASLPPHSREHRNLELIRQAGMRARDLVKQILAFSRREAPKMELVQLQALVDDTLAMLRASIPATIRIDMSTEDVPPVIADPGQLQQVLVNLVTNAAQAIGGGMGLISVVLSAEAGGGAVCLSVTDTGCGMNDATRQRIFDPFFTTKPAGEGTGLGLAVVHGIVSSHGGRIDVTSTPGRGTRVEVHLPMLEPEPASGRSGLDAEAAA